MEKVLLTIVLLLPVVSFACEVTDGLGNRITLKQPAKRIISLTPALTENLFAIGAGDRIFGVIKDSDYPEAAKALPIVGAYNALDRERMIVLKPDLIVTWGHGLDASLAYFQEKGIPVYVTNTQKLEDVAKTLSDLGCLTGQQQQATKVSQEYLRALTKLKQKAALKKRLSVFYQLDTHSLLTINHSSWIDQAIRYCGGENIFAALPLSAPEVSMEAVVAANPDVIIASGDDPRWRRWKKMRAVNQQHLYKINPDLISRPTPRLVMGVRDICSFISHSRA